MENVRKLSASNEWRDQTMRRKYLYNESRFRFTWESQLEMRAWIFPWHWIFDQKLETWKKRLESKILDTICRLTLPICIIKFECIKLKIVQKIDIDIGIYMYDWIFIWLALAFWGYIYSLSYSCAALIFTVIFYFSHSDIAQFQIISMFVSSSDK